LTALELRARSCEKPRARRLFRAEEAKGARTSAAAIGFVVTTFVFSGSMVGMELHRFLPPEHLSEDARDIAMLGTGMLSVRASLVLGLLVATAKSSYDTKDTNMRS
jgi:hypothetical protein